MNKKTGNRYNIISVEKSSIVFSEKILTKHEINHLDLNISFNKESVFPICRNNHYFLVILSLMNETIKIIDPIGNENVYKNIFFTKIKKVLNLLNPEIKLSNISTPKHVLQKDGYNCGPIIIKIFSDMTKNTSLQLNTNFDEYRNTLKKLLLNNSDEMTNRCLYCSELTIEENSNKCIYCKRLIHFRCQIDVRQKNFKIYKMINFCCDLCKANTSM